MFLSYGYPTSLREVIDCLKNDSLQEGEHVEFKSPRTVNYGTLFPIIVRLAIMGGGILVLGVTSPAYRFVRVTGIHPEIEKKLSEQFTYYVKSRSNDVSCRLEFGDYQGKRFAVVFVEPSFGGKIYVGSEKNPADRTYYYKRGDRVEIDRFQYQKLYKYMLFPVSLQ